MLIPAYNLIKINFLDYLPFLYIRTIYICIYCKYCCLMGRLVFQLIHNDQNYANLFYKKAFLLFSYFIFFPFIILYKYHIISFIKNQAAGGTSPKTHQPRRRTLCKVKFPFKCIFSSRLSLNIFFTFKREYKEICHISKII